jgi:hypothetical protein
VIRLATFRSIRPLPDQIRDIIDQIRPSAAQWRRLYGIRQETMPMVFQRLVCISLKSLSAGALQSFRTAAALVCLVSVGVADAQPATKAPAITPATYYGASHALLIGVNKYPKRI